jgi:hypothetical protein
MYHTDKLVERWNMSDKQRWFIVLVEEWSGEFGPLSWGEVNFYRGKKDYKDWQLPTPEDFEKSAEFTASLGFSKPDETYWAFHNGDAMAIRPIDPGTRSVCNRYDVKHRLRLIRQVKTEVCLSGKAGVSSSGIKFTIRLDD